MKKVLALGLLSLLLFSCGGKREKNVVVVAGKVENLRTDSIYFINNDLKKSIPIVNGEFRDTLKLEKPTYFFMYLADERVQTFLNPSDSLYVFVDYNAFDETLKYSGDTEAENNYLLRKQLDEKEKIHLDPQAYFSVDATEFKNQIDATYDHYKADLAKSSKNGKFKDLENKNLEYQRYLMLSQYHFAHNYFTQSNIEMPEEFKKELDQADLDNEEAFVSVPSYRDYISFVYGEKIDKLKSGDGVIEFLDSIKSSSIKEEVMEQALMYLIGSADKNAEAYYDYLQANSTNAELKKEAADEFAKVQKILAGQVSPMFTYPDINGKEVSLESLKGKLVYIDVWAQWCVPCLNEIPSMKKLVEDYADKNVEFVGVSIDKMEDKAKWEAMVKEKDLKGIQVLADQDWKSQFAKDYNVMGIPRFILIDAEGKIIAADAPRPSNPEIRTLIDANL